MTITQSSDNQFYFDVIDGWGGNLDQGGVISDSIEPAAEHRYAASGTTPLKRGAFVMQTHDNTRPTVTIPLLNTIVESTAKGDPQRRFWMVAEGNTEVDYSSRLGRNKVVCLRGAFTIKTAHIKGSPAIGDKLTIEHDTTGTVGATLPHNTIGGNPGLNEGRLETAGANDTVIGFVVDTEVINGVTVYTCELNF